MEVGEDEHVIAIELDHNGMMMKLSPPDNEIESPPPIPVPSGSDDASDPELLEEEEEEEMNAPAQHPLRPMTLCGGMTEFDEDYLNGWEVIWQDDPGFEHGLPPFFGNRGTNVVGVSPMDFFNFLFRDTMWGQIANHTNEYALQRQQRLGPDAVARMEHPDYKRFAHQNLWKPVSIEDIRVFAAHLILLGLIKKPELSDYWSHKELTRTPFSECTCRGTDSKPYWAASMWQMTRQIPLPWPTTSTFGQTTAIHWCV